jgi:hypothetical protein
MTELTDFIGADDLEGLVAKVSGAAGPEVSVPVNAALAVRHELGTDRWDPSDALMHGELPGRPGGDAAGFFPWFAHEAGLTSKEHYEGLPAALGLGYYYLWPPIRALWTIEQQFSGVLDQAYRWLKASSDALGAAATDAQKAEKSVEGGAQVIVQDLEKAVQIFDTTVTGWL